MAELKPCPFCGGEAKMIIHHNEQMNYVRYSVECQRCLTESNKYFVPKIAEESWNMRHDEELVFVRQFIHDHGLEFALLDAWNRRAGDGDG